MERLTWQIRHGLLGRQTKCTSALAPLLGKEFHFSAPVPISLCNPWVFAILIGVGRNARAVGNNTDTGRAICQESHFTHSPGPGSRTSMSCTHRASYSSVFDRQRKPRGWPGSALCPPLPSTAQEARSMSIWREGHAGECIGMPTIPARAAPVSAISDGQRPSRWLVWMGSHKHSGPTSSPPRGSRGGERGCGRVWQKAVALGGGGPTNGAGRLALAG